MSRKLAREAAMKLIYQMEIQRDLSTEAVEKTIEEYPDEPKAHEYIRDVLYKYLQHQQEVDEVIGRHARDWKIDRIAKVDLSILRLAVVEILYKEDIPNSVSINEAVEMAKEYSTEESGSFINGVLGNIVGTSE